MLNSVFIPIPKLPDKAFRIIQLREKVKINLFQFSLRNLSQLIQNTMHKEARQPHKQLRPPFQTIRIKIHGAVPPINGSVKIIDIQSYNLKPYSKVTIRIA